MNAQHGWSPSNDDEIDDVLGADDGDAPRRESARVLPLTPRERRHVPEPLPAADEIAGAQYASAVYRVHRDPTRFPRFPWRAVDDVAGAMCPGDLWVVGGRTGNGKSTFLLNLFDRLVDPDGPAPRIVLYIGLEQEPDELRIKWACLRRSIPPKHILAPRPEFRATESARAERDAVQDEMRWQQTPGVRVRAHFTPVRFVDRAALREWTGWAVDQGCDLVIVDHINRVRHGEGRNPFHEFSETVRLAKELAVEHKLVMLLAQQIGRPTGDPVARFTPPALHELRGGGTAEEEANAVLAVYRPLRPDVSKADLEDVRKGLRAEDTIYAANTMAVRVLKHRLDGDALGKQALLGVERGRLTDLSAVHAHSAAEFSRGRSY